MSLPLEQELRIQQLIQASTKKEKVPALTLDELLGAHTTHTKPTMDNINKDGHAGSTAKVYLTQAKSGGQQL